jgi:HSP20 family protein
MDFKRKKIGKNNSLPTERNPVAMFPWDAWFGMDRFFNQFRNEFDDFLLSGSRNLMHYDTTQPPLDLVDQGGSYEMHVDILDIPKDKVDIEVTPNSIHISAEHETNNGGKEGNVLKNERNFFKYFRTIEFPEEILTDDVSAEMRDGVLTVILPKTEPDVLPESKKIDIK